MLLVAGLRFLRAQLCLLLSSLLHSWLKPLVRAYGLLAQSWSNELPTLSPHTTRVGVGHMTTQPVSRTEGDDLRVGRGLVSSWPWAI